MKPSRHLKTTAVLSVAVAPWLGWRALLVLAGGTLLDLDRYAGHAFRYRTLRVREAIERFQGRDRLRGDLRVMHSVEFLTLVAIACVVWPAVWPFALGVVVHLALDVMVHKSQGRFWLYPDVSHLQILTLRLWKKDTAPERPAKGGTGCQPVQASRVEPTRENKESTYPSNQNPTRRGE